MNYLITFLAGFIGGAIVVWIYKSKAVAVISKAESQVAAAADAVKKV
jgi:hypothetical protein